MVKILRKSYENHKTQSPKFSVFIAQKSIFRRYCIQKVKDGTQIQVCNIKSESVKNFNHFNCTKVKKNLRKSQVQFGETLRKLRLRQNDGFLIKNLVIDNKFAFEEHISKLCKRLAVNYTHLFVSVTY